MTILLTFEDARGNEHELDLDVCSTFTPAATGRDECNDPAHFDDIFAGFEGCDIELTPAEEETVIEKLWDARAKEMRDWEPAGWSD